MAALIIQLPGSGPHYIILCLTLRVLLIIEIAFVYINACILYVATPSKYHYLSTSIALWFSCNFSSCNLRPMFRSMRVYFDLTSAVSLVLLLYILHIISMYISLLLTYFAYQDFFQYNPCFCKRWLSLSYGQCLGLIGPSCCSI